MQAHGEGPDPDPPPAAATQPQPLAIVRAHDGYHLTFTMNRSFKFSQFKQAYANVVGIPVSTVRFFFNGAELDDDETPEQVGLNFNDLIRVAFRNMDAVNAHLPARVSGP